MGGVGETYRDFNKKRNIKSKQNMENEQNIYIYINI